MSNVGRTPAMGVLVSPKLILSHPKADPIGERPRLCGEAITHSQLLGSTVFPNDKPLEQIWTFSASKADIAEALKTISFVVPVAIVCVGYQSYFDDKARYFTGMIYTLDQPRPDNLSLSILMQSGKNVPSEQLRVREY
jgi:hypothetical protein